MPMMPTRARISARPNLDDDLEQDTDLSDSQDEQPAMPAVAPDAAPAMGMPGDYAAKKAALYDKLAQRKAADNRMLDAEEERGQRQSEFADRNNLAAVLADSMAKMGSIGGETADAAPVRAFANQEIAQNNTLGDSRAKLYQGLQDKLDKREDAGLKDVATEVKADAMAKRQEKTDQRLEAGLAETKRNHLATEKNSSIKAEAAATNAGNGVDLTPKEVQKQFKDLEDSVNANKARAGNLGDYRKTVNRANNLLELAKTNGGKLDRAETEELALGLANLVKGGGSGTESQVAALVPHTAVGDANALFQYFSNHPESLNQPDFVARMTNIVNRQKDLAEGNIEAAYAQMVTNKSHLRKYDPERFKRVMLGAGLDPDSFDDNGVYVSKRAKGGAHPANVGTHDEALEWANDPANAKDPRAAKIKSMHGVQ